MHPELLPLMLFCFVTSCTPGPNNILASYSSFNFGIKKTLPHMVGIPFGHVIQITLVCFGLGSLFIKYPVLFEILRYVGSAYILYLAYKMFGSLNITKTEERSRPLKYYEAILFQLQ